MTQINLKKNIKLVDIVSFITKREKTENWVSFDLKGLQALVDSKVVDSSTSNVGLYIYRETLRQNSLVNLFNLIMLKLSNVCTNPTCSAFE